MRDLKVANGSINPFLMLEVGFRAKPKGDVNVIFNKNKLYTQDGKQTEKNLPSHREVKDALIADGANLPFKNCSFEVAYSNHSIERIKNPSGMLSEMSRVAKRKVIIQVAHRKGRAAKLRNCMNRFDEAWFEEQAKRLGFGGVQIIRYLEPPPGPKLETRIPPANRNTLLWKGIVSVEKKALRRFRVPVEMEVSLKKTVKPAYSDDVEFVVVYNNAETLKRSFLSSSNVSLNEVITYENSHDEPLPVIYNKIIQEHMDKNVWLVFCHQDFVFRENLRLRLRAKDTEAIYGPIGGHPSQEKLIGSIIQKDGTAIGSKLRKETPVQTLDEMCLIAHAKIFKEGLIFDESFKFHFYGADLCMQAYKRGFDVLAMQIDCQHQSRTLRGDLNSQEYLASLKLFKEKWEGFLPIRTTTSVTT